MVKYLEKISGFEEERPIVELPTLIIIGIIFMSFCFALSVLFLPWYLSLFLFIGLCLSISVFFNLYLGILIFLVGAFFHPTYWFPQLQAFHPARSLAIGVLFIWGFHTLFYRDFRFVKAPQIFFLIGFLIIALISTFNQYFDFCFGHFLEFGTKAFVLYFAIANLVKSRGQVIFFSWFLVTIGLVLAMIGIYQYINHIGVVYREEGILRISGLAEDPNLFAMDLATIIPVGIGLFFAGSDKLKKMIILCITFLMAVTTILTFSRAGFLQLSTVLFFSVGLRAFRKNKFLTFITILLVVLMVLPLVPEKYWQRMQTMTNLSDPAIGKRISGWIVGTELIIENPIRGVGLGIFRYKFAEHALSSANVPYKERLDAHNTYIHTAAEIGIFGLFFRSLVVGFII